MCEVELVYVRCVGAPISAARASIKEIFRFLVVDCGDCGGHLTAAVGSPVGKVDSEECKIVDSKLLQRRQLSIKGHGRAQICLRRRAATGSR